MGNDAGVGGGRGQRGGDYQLTARNTEKENTMEEHIKAIEGLIEVNKAITPRTPFLEVALGALHTASANATQHVAELERLAKARAATLATLETARTAIVQEEVSIAAAS